MFRKYSHRDKMTVSLSERPPDLLDARGNLLPLQSVAHLTIVHRRTRKYAPVATKGARP